MSSRPSTKSSTTRTLAAGEVRALELALIYAPVAGNAGIFEASIELDSGTDAKISQYARTVVLALPVSAA